MRLLLLVTILLISGCTTVSQEISAYQKSQIEVLKREPYQPKVSKTSFHAHVELLARQLFDTANSIDSNRAIVVGTFLPADSLTPSLNQQVNQFGLQLQESFATFSTQAGLTVVEFKAMSAIHMMPSADQMLSRDQQKINQNVNAEYMLTGTYIPMEHALNVNVRLIDTTNNTIVAAATGPVPLNSMWSHEKVKMQNNQIYRGEY